jgi:hypothetical protein
MRRRNQRGAAIVEMALLAPILVALLVFSELLTELVIVRVRLRGAARFAAWEIPSHPLFDFRAGGSTLAPALAAAERDALERYGGLDPVDMRGSFRGLAAGVGAVEIQVREEGRLRRPHFDGALDPDGGGEAARIAARVERAPAAYLERWGFGQGGWMVARASAPIQWLRRPAALAEGLAPVAEVALVAGDWSLRDGADVVAARGRSGVHRDGTRSALWRQVKRMRLLGEPGGLAAALAVAREIGGLLPVPPPDFDGAFVVDQNVGPARGRGCDEAPGYPSHGRGSLANLADILDSEAPACFGTVPFRDTQEYRDSLYARAHAPRGGYFLGCRNPEADDPSRGTDEDMTDGNALKVHCEGRP